MIKLIFISFIYPQVTKVQTISTIIVINYINSCLQKFNFKTARIRPHSRFFLCVISLLKNKLLNRYYAILGGRKTYNKNKEFDGVMYCKDYFYNEVRLDKISIQLVKFWSMMNSKSPIENLIKLQKGIYSNRSDLHYINTYIYQI